MSCVITTALSATFETRQQFIKHNLIDQRLKRAREEHKEKFDFEVET